MMRGANPCGLLFLFDVNVSGAGTVKLLHKLARFGHSCSLGLQVGGVLPSLCTRSPSFCHGVHVRSLTRKVRGLVHGRSLPNLVLQTFSALPRVVVAPRRT